ncbi:conjugative transposon protein TraM [Mucilaginibacter sp. HC2]|jgi:conjugative transposon TraM protein|uniref:conjugative transposon protein TraM n=1 Tax=Mucilaginibacter inviolabilis TaxID=2714892 RepID=UPI00140A1933|nr:conjugative transposon protein TraM [Mucilaginibacter inviolabilis]NHA02538.1 conjugative transposon protein TraM [Mucilaginibacter inviolabilis]
MQINFKQPRYIVPLILLPFLCLFFYVFHGKAKEKGSVNQPAAIQGNVGDVSAHVKKSALSDKLDAFRNTYKESDGLTAVSPVTNDETAGTKLSAGYSDKQRMQLDSIDRAMKARFSSGMTAPPAKQGASVQDRQVTAALNALAAQRKAKTAPASYAGSNAAEREKDPMAVFKQQMAYVDSMQKANDPALRSEREKQQAKVKALAGQPVALEVRKAPEGSGDFNTIKPDEHSELISAIIDEDVTAYAGSRIRLRLMEDIWAGKNLIPKGSMLYGLVNGFTQQRVTFVINSVLSAGQILPVKLSVYDQDGILGLYVPASAFRDFTKDLSGNTMQGVSIESGSAGNQLLMSSMDKIFQSTSSAIAGAIRKNKAKIKYGTYVYLVDPQTIQNNR